MSFLLPIFVSPQSGPETVTGVPTEPLRQLREGQSRASGPTYTQYFSQVVHEHGDASVFLKHLQSLISRRSQQDGVSTVPLLQKDVRLPETSVGSETVEKVLGTLQADRIQESLEEPLLSALDLDRLLGFGSLLPLSPQSHAVPSIVTNEFVLRQNPEIAIEQASLPRAVPTLPLSPLQGIQAPVRTVFQDNRFQQNSGNSFLELAKQESGIGGRHLGIAQLPLPKELESGSIRFQGSVGKVAESELLSQKSSQGSVIEPASLGLEHKEELSVRTVVPSAKVVSGGLQQVGRSVIGNETLAPPILSKFFSTLARPQNVQSNHIPPATARQAEGPVGFAEPNLTNQIAGKSIPGNSSVLGDVSRAGIEHRTTVQADLLGEAGLLSKGERVQTIVEAPVKSVGLDPSGGQGLNSGMNHSSNSQSGFQQPSSFPGQGVGLRAFEERGPELPVPALQRLQMDVQLSESQRVQIDVGVQNRQVYAGLVMDHSVLRNLAAQLVPELENQLAEVDMELQEFSAQVRKEPEQETDTMFRDSRSHEAQESGRRSQGELLSTQNSLNRYEEKGLHLVA